LLKESTKLHHTQALRSCRDEDLWLISVLLPLDKKR
jgi:hypothetical protein